MNKLAKEFQDRGVVFYVLYTREPHAGQRLMGFDFSGKSQTRNAEERAENARELVRDRAEQRPILIDTFGENSLQAKIGGNRPNSLIVIDGSGKIALWQDWANPAALRKNLDEMTSAKSAGKSASPDTK